MKILVTGDIQFFQKCQYGHPHQFLQGALDPPSSLAVTRALGLLREVGACLADEATLTPLGHHLAALPVDVRIGKMLLLAAVFGCLEEVVGVYGREPLSSSSVRIFMSFQFNLQKGFENIGRDVKAL